MHKPVVILWLSLIFTSFPTTAYQVAGVDIPDTVSPGNGGPKLVLNGAGVREKLFLDIYIGALYLPEKTGDAQTILAGSGPASVLMHILYKEVSKEKITGGWTDGLTANLAAGEMAALQPRLDEFNTLFRTVHKGDRIQISYLPGSGTEVRINGELRGTIEGETFFRALLRVWLGSQPVSTSLKQEMLGSD